MLTNRQMQQRYPGYMVLGQRTKGAMTIGPIEGGRDTFVDSEEHARAICAAWGFTLVTQAEATRLRQVPELRVVE